MVKNLFKGLIVVFLLLCFSSFVFTSDSFALEKMDDKRVLILHSYYKGYKWTDDEHKGIESVLGPKIGNNNLYVEYMDTKKIYGALYSQRLLEVYKLKYKNFKFDTIIATDNNAFEFLLKYREILFVDTPVVFCGVNFFDKSDLKEVKKFTGVNEENDFVLNIELILKLHPKTKHIIFINEWTTTGRAVHGAFLKVMPQFNKDIEFMLLEDVPLEYIIDMVNKNDEDSAILYTAFSKDKSGQIFEYNESLKLIAKNATIPIYTPYEFNLGLGVVGGLMISGYDQGEVAAQIVLRILQGETIENIPVKMVTPKRYIFDYEQMQKFSIGKSDLPEGTYLINVPETFYYKYKELIAMIAIVFFALLFIISALLLNIYKRKLYEKELKSSQEELRGMARRLVETEEKGRKNISRELHDQVGQNLTILGVNLNILRTLVDQNKRDLIDSRIRDSVSLVKQTTGRIRNLMDNLRSTVLDDYGLIAAIDFYAKQFSKRSGLQISVRGDKKITHVSEQIENTLFRIVQESLINVVKHAKATEVIITLSKSNENLRLSIEDNGIGYDTNRSTPENGEYGYGVVTMNERALSIGGVYRIRSKKGMGTHITVEVPK